MHLKRPRLGILPLYIKLYDTFRPSLRGEFGPLFDGVTAGLTAAGCHVSVAPICTVAEEFRAAIAQLEHEGADVIVTLHLAYSPSGESIEALCGTRLPIIMLDTTMDAAFDQQVDPLRLLYNHGIHGVQDLACVLRRRQRPYAVVAGPMADASIYQRAADLARAHLASEAFRSMRVLRLGAPFHAMHDFAVAPELLWEKFGITVEQTGPDHLAHAIGAVTADEVAAELASDRELYQVDCPAAVHERSVRLGLGLRHYLAAKHYGAFSFNFLSFDSADGPVNTVPFLEASKAMARGVGYAGEGDVLTASLVGALTHTFPETTFTEMFCPDWAGNRVFTSHMGEINPVVCAGKARLCEKDYQFTKALNPAMLAGAPRPGRATWVNLSPGPDHSFRLILAKVTSLEDSQRPEYQGWVRGWFRADLPVAPFLEEYSRLGGTHHAALMMGDKVEALKAFAAETGMECREITD